MLPPPATAAAVFVVDSRHRFTFPRRRRTVGGRKNKRTCAESEAELLITVFLPTAKISETFTQPCNDLSSHATLGTSPAPTLLENPYVARLYFYACRGGTSCDNRLLIGLQMYVN